PEQVASSKVDGRSDLYSAGIMLYELVCGRPPFIASEADGPFTLMAKHVQSPPPPPTLHRPDVDPELEGVILKALAKRPEDRYQSGDEFDLDLARVADRLAPGWERSLLPGADLSRMVPGAALATSGMAALRTAAGVAATPGPATAGVVPAQPVPLHTVYNPTPPVKVAPKKASAGCLAALPPGL